MTTRIIITGTGTPVFEPGRAGPGVAIEYNGQVLQFDTGRATVMRMAEASLSLLDLEAVFLTHTHSDHVVGLSDLLMSYWLEDVNHADFQPLPVFAAGTMAASLATDLLDPWSDEIAMRQGQSGHPSDARPRVIEFAAPEAPELIFEADGLEVRAFAVRHEPVPDAVGYRIDTPDGSVVITGDTRVCDEVERAAVGADVVIYEAFCRSAVPEGLLSDPDRLASYHADTLQIGASASRLNTQQLLLTHLIPAPRSAEDRQAFVDDVRQGGYTGNVTVCDDLFEVTL